MTRLEADPGRHAFPGPSGLLRWWRSWAGARPGQRRNLLSDAHNQVRPSGAGDMARCGEKQGNQGRHASPGPTGTSCPIRTNGASGPVKRAAGADKERSRARMPSKFVHIILLRSIGQGAARVRSGFRRGARCRFDGEAATLRYKSRPTYCPRVAFRISCDKLCRRVRLQDLGFARRNPRFARRFVGFLRRSVGFLRGLFGQNESIYAP